LRLTGAALSAERLYVAHQTWNGTERCFTMRVSSVALGADLAATGPWETVYDTVPCLSFEPPFDDSETGGHLALAPDGDLLLTVGDHGFSGLDGSEPFAQSDGDYGKILKIAPEGSAQAILSRGHRNAQGLTVASDGRIWSAEHGPQGGDELNLILPGKNYGWPLVTYGTNYGSTAWPLNPEGRDHGAFEEPAIAFVPSVAVCPLIEITGEEFPRWRGDLLIGALRARSLYRVRLSGDRAVYVEPIHVGEQIRDLVQTPDGKILIWTDPAGLLEVSQRADAGGAYARYCAGCHTPAFGPPAGPPLDGVIGRRIAGVEGFAYSAGLKAKAGNWTEDRLNAFLADPEAFAPGTRMRLPSLDEEVRAEIVESLRR
jgi:cytochrome c2